MESRCPEEADVISYSRGTTTMPGVAWDGMIGECTQVISNGQVEQDEPSTTNESAFGKVCILSIDGGGMRGIIPGRILAYLETALKTKSGNPNAKICDYFDIAAGTSVGGILTTMLFTNDGTGSPLFSGEQSWKLIAEKGQQIFKIPKSQRAWKKLRGIMTPRYSTKYLEGILKHHLIRDGRELTLRDTLKPVLIPCYDLQSAGPFLFSRADALDCEAWDFSLWEICRATSAVPSFFKPALMTAKDGIKKCTAIDGGIVMNNPTSAAITHVLHNKGEFPSVRGMCDLLVLSLGTGQFDQTYGYKTVRHWGAFQWAKPIVKIILDGISDMVDHTISMSFGDLFRKNYVRVQVSGLPDRALTEMDDGSQRNVNRLTKLADELLHQKSMEHLPFGGRRALSVSNMERLDWFAEQLIQEQKARLSRKSPTVNLKNATRDRCWIHSRVNCAICEDHMTVRDKLIRILSNSLKDPGRCDGLIAGSTRCSSFTSEMVVTSKFGFRTTGHSSKVVRSIAKFQLHAGSYASKIVRI